MRAGKSANRFVTEASPVPWLIHGGTDNYVREGVRCISWQRLALPELPEVHPI
jgi:hypothetical protein